MNVNEKIRNGLKSSMYKYLLITLIKKCSLYIILGTIFAYLIIVNSTYFLLRQKVSS